MAPVFGEAEIGQISVYLAKPEVDFTATLDWDEVTAKLNCKIHELNVGGVPCHFVYFETRTSKSTPPWLEFANAQLSPDDQIDFSSTSLNANGILGIKLDKRVFVAVFGRSASALLIRKSLEPDFGIRTAMNLCGNEEIRQTTTHSHSLIPTHIDRQVGQPADSFVFGLSEAEDLRSISACLKGNPLVTLQGRNHLTIKALGSEKLSWDRLIGHCRDFLKAYASTDYVSLFPNYRNFKPANEKESEALDQRLIETLSAGQLDSIQLWIPEFIADDEYSFTYTDNEKRDNNVYGYLEPMQLQKELRLNKITIKSLRDKRVFAYSHIEDHVLSYKWWWLYDCIIFEQKLDDRHFILTDGEWKCIDDDFYRSVIDFVEKKVLQLPCEPLYAGISMADYAARKNREAVFNTEVCRRRPQSIRFDQAKLRIGADRKDKEFCDILDLTDGGTIRIINCKPYKGSSTVSYLFAQTRFYCESFLRDQVFLTEIRKHIEASTCPIKDAYLAYIKSEIRGVTGSDYEVCVWLLCDNREKLPDKSDLPFMAQYELKLMHDHLQQTWKFKEVVLRAIPVEMVNFVTATKPKKTKSSVRS